MKCRLLLSLALLTLTGPLFGSTFEAMTPGQLVAGSAAIVEGNVLKVQSFWDADHRVILTEALVQVRDVIAGETPSVVRVKTFGGTLGDYTIEAIGFPTFARGERIVVFLEEEADPDVLRVTGFQQGLFRVAVDPAGEEVAHSAVDEGAHLVHANGRASLIPSSLPLAQLKQQIRAEVARQWRGEN
jgi:hypothetical protein